MTDEPNDPEAGATAMGDADWATIDSHLRRGKKIEAIKHFRKATRGRLIDAKEAVEARLEILAKDEPRILALNKGGGCAGILVLAAAVTGLAGKLLWELAAPV